MVDSTTCKCYVLWMPFTYFTRFVVKVLDQFLGTGEEMNEVEWKQKKGVSCFIILLLSYRACFIKILNAWLGSMQENKYKVKITGLNFSFSLTWQVGFQGLLFFVS